MTAFRLGLTGSIGMGKSTTAGFFADEGIPVWDADTTVHRLYAPGGALVPVFAARWPDSIVAGGVDRAALKSAITADPDRLEQIEALVHPAVAADRAEFVARTTSDLVLLDVPLLYETGSDTAFDAVLLVTAPPDVQRARVLARPGMTAEQFETIRARQMPDREKRARATHIIETLGLDAVRLSVRALIDYIRKTRDA